MSEENEKTTLEGNGIKLLFGDISLTSVRPVIEWILLENLKPNPLKELSLVINTCGGDAVAMFALTDVMEGSRIPIKTIALGEISSCGFFIFIAGAKGKRMITPNTSILSHQYSWGRFGKEHELVATNKEYTLLTERVHNFYEKHITITNKAKKKKVIEEILLGPSDMYLSAKEALEYGACDEVKLV